MSENFWDTYAETAQAESGGGGIICKARVETGYKVYVSGYDQADTFFPFPAGDDSAKAKAKSGAQALGRPQFGVQIRAFRDSAVVRGVHAEWQNDRFFNTDSWTDAAKKVVVPSLKDNGIAKLPFEGWVRIGFQNDPYKEAQGAAGMTDTDQNNNPRYPQVAYIVEVFKDEDAARAAIGNVEESGNGGDVPPGWEKDTWVSVHGEMYRMQKESQPPVPPAEIAKAYGLDPETQTHYVVKAIANYIPM